MLIMGSVEKRNCGMLVTAGSPNARDDDISHGKRPLASTKPFWYTVISYHGRASSSKFFFDERGKKGWSIHVV